MNIHIFLDKFSIFLVSFFARNKKFFSQDLNSPSLVEQVNSVKVELPEIRGEGAYNLKALTVVGELETAFYIAQWKGPEYPTLIYHHGSNEHPFDFRKTAKNTFYQIFFNDSDAVESNLIIVKAPFHNNSLRSFQNEMRRLSNFIAMLAVSVQVTEELIKHIKTLSSERIITAGISLGGWICNLHKGIYNTSTIYCPFLAGTYLGELFIQSQYRKLVSRNGLEHPEQLRKMLNFQAIFESNKCEHVYPLLAKYDQYVEYDEQIKSYTGIEVKTIKRGHITGALAYKKLRAHLDTILDKTAKSRW